LREQEQPDQWSRSHPVQRGGEPPPSAVEQPDQSNGDLSNPEQVQRSIERDLALTVKAKRRQEENIVEAGQIRNAHSRFELTRDQIVFGLKLAVTMFCMIALAVFAFTNAAPVKLVLSGCGTVAGIISLLFRSSSDQREPAPVAREDSGT
jgi:hypothetical protein